MIRFKGAIKRPGYGVGRVIRSGGSDFRWIGHVSQQVIKVAKQHESNRSTQVAPVLFAGTELRTAILIPSVAQFQYLMDEKGQQVEDKKVVR